jgi:hypothetical protein
LAANDIVELDHLCHADSLASGASRRLQSGPLLIGWRPKPEVDKAL